MIEDLNKDNSEHIPLSEGAGGGNSFQASSNNHYAYNKQLQPLASKLRKEMTKAEACLWKYALRASIMKGYVFNRQRPVLNFIVDFLSKKLLLIIEVDGYSHQSEEAYQKDTRRQKKLEAIGYKVIRFNDDDVLKDIKNVIRAIEIIIEEREIELGLNPPPARINHTPSPFSFGEVVQRTDEVERGTHLQ